MKKSLLTLGTIVTVAAPVVAVVSCGSKIKIKPGTTQTNGAQGTTQANGVQGTANVESGKTGSTDFSSIQPAPGPVMVKKWRVLGRAGMDNEFDTKAEAITWIDSNKSAYFLPVLDFWKQQARNLQPEQLIIKDPGAAAFDADGGIDYSTIQAQKLLLPADGSLPKVWEIENKYYATEELAYHAWSKYDKIKIKGHDGIMTLFAADGVTKIHDIIFSTLSARPALLQVLHDLTWSLTTTNNAAGNDVYTLKYKGVATSYTKEVATGSGAPANFGANDLNMASVSLPAPDIKYTISDFRNLNPQRDAYSDAKAQIMDAGAVGLPTSSISALTTSTKTVYRIIVDNQTTKCYKDIGKIYSGWAAIKAGSETKALVCLTDEKRFNTEDEIKEHIIKEVEVSVG